MKQIVVEYITGIDCDKSAHVNKLMEHEKKKYKNDCNLIPIGIQDFNNAFQYVISDDHQKMKNSIMNGQQLDMPYARINRSEGQWYDVFKDEIGEDVMKEEMNKEEVVTIRMTPEYDNNNNLIIHYEMKYKKELNSSAVRFCLLEDNIIAPQRVAEDNIDYNYVHNNVFKKIILNQKIDNPKKNEIFFGSIKYPLDASLFSNIDNCRIVCYVMDETKTRILGAMSGVILKKSVLLMFRKLKNRIRKFWLKIF